MTIKKSSELYKIVRTIKTAIHKLALPSSCKEGKLKEHIAKALGFKSYNALIYALPLKLNLCIEIDEKFRHIFFENHNNSILPQGILFLGFHIEHFSITISNPNLRNDHIYLAGPPFTCISKKYIGKNNEANKAESALIIFEGIGIIKSDFDGTKKILRKRSVIKQFFELHGIKDSQKINFYKIAADLYMFSTN